MASTVLHTNFHWKEEKKTPQIYDTFDYNYTV